MLKLTYTETGFCLELLTLSIEQWLHRRLIVSVRAGSRFCVEPSSASFLLPKTVAGVSELERLQSDTGGMMEICPADADYVEVILSGSWIAEDNDCEEGIFITTLTPRAEFFLVKLWQEVPQAPIES